MSALPITKLMTLLFLCLLPTLTWAEYIRGIYLTQYTLESTKTLKYLIEKAKKTGINTFVVDINRISKRYNTNIKLLKENNIRYVARIVVFPNGGTHDQVSSEKYWNNKYKLAQQAVALGAAEIQLDYIRYNTKRKQSSDNAKNIHTVIKWFRERLANTNTKLQIAVFGETCHKPSLAIGQDIKLFSNDIDTLNPMVYPSHYWPYGFHSKRPYETIYDSLQACKGQFGKSVPFKLYPYIEISNIRYRNYGQEKVAYIYKQIKAVQDSDVDGWYAWSANNKYNPLFKALQTYNIK